MVLDHGVTLTGRMKKITSAGNLAYTSAIPSLEWLFDKGGKVDLNKTSSDKKSNSN